MSKALIKNVKKGYLQRKAFRYIRQSGIYHREREKRNYGGLIYG
nr:MAG TPA: hypothetical protein [Caudoviricetes sp.]